MRLRISYVLASAAAGFAILVACGARTGLYGTDLSPVTDGGSPFADVGALYEGGPLDAHVDTLNPPYCDPSDLGYIYQGGQPIYQCGSLDQCEVRAGSAQCINPCMDSLGNDTSNGCEFYAVEMDTNTETSGACYAVFVVNQWKSGQPARILVTLPGQNLPPIEQYARIPTGTGTGITYGPYDGENGLPMGQIAILFLSRDPAAANAVALQTGGATDPKVLASCPNGVTPAILGDAALHGTGTAMAFHIQTNVPVVAYQMLPYGAGRARVTGATLLMPTNTWDTNYVIADAYQGSPLLNSTNPVVINRAGPTTVVIASQDSTHVTINPTVDIVGGGSVGSAEAGTPTTYALNQGQYLQITPEDPSGLSTNNLELTGSALQSDKPVGVIGGSTLMDIPVTAATATQRADHAEQMIPPVRALGNEYVAVRYRNRQPDAGIDESPPWRLVGVVDQTQVTFDHGNGSLSSITFNAGDVFQFDDPGPFVVTSQDVNHPFLFASYMTGGGCHGVALPDPAYPECNDLCDPASGDYHGFGDPEFIVVVPPAQYLPRYTFFTDPTYPETNLVIVRAYDVTSGQWPDITLSCAGATPLGGWQPVGSSGMYEMTRFDLSTGNFQGGIGTCNNGVNSITGSFASPGVGGTLVPRFGVTVWGWGNDQTYPYDGVCDGGFVEDESNPQFTRWVSYGYPAGANFQPLNSAVMSTRP
jgi:hypothetical protein